MSASILRQENPAYEQLPPLSSIGMSPLPVSEPIIFNYHSHIPSSSFQTC